MEERRKSRILIPALLLVTIVACAIAFYLWRQNVELRSRTETPGNDEASTRVQRLREGIEVPEFMARDTEGREARVASRGNGATLLFIFSPTCDRCEAGMPAWIKVSNKLAELKSESRVIALSTADSYTTVEYARRAKVPFAIVPFPNVELQKQYGVTEVPLTVVVDDKGVARAVWNKPLDEGEVADVVETVCPECVKRAVKTRD